MFAPPWPRAQTALSWCGGRKAGRGSGPHCVALVPLSPFLAKDMFYLKPRKHAAHFLCGILDSPPPLWVVERARSGGNAAPLAPPLSPHLLPLFPPTFPPLSNTQRAPMGLAGLSRLCACGTPVSVPNLSPPFPLPALERTNDHGHNELFCLCQGNDVRLVYRDEPHFRILANELGVFEEWKDGLPRASYHGEGGGRGTFGL